MSKRERIEEIVCNICYTGSEELDEWEVYGLSREDFLWLVERAKKANEYEEIIGMNPS